MDDTENKEKCGNDKGIDPTAIYSEVQDIVPGSRYSVAVPTNGKDSTANQERRGSLPSIPNLNRCVEGKEAFHGKSSPSAEYATIETAGTCLVRSNTNLISTANDEDGRISSVCSLDLNPTSASSSVMDEAPYTVVHAEKPMATESRGGDVIPDNAAVVIRLVPASCQASYTTVTNAGAAPSENTIQSLTTSGLETASTVTIHAAPPADNHYSKIDGQHGSDVLRNKEGEEQCTLAESARDSTAIPLYTLPVKAVKEGSGRSPSSNFAAHASELSLSTGEEPETCNAGISPPASGPPKVLPYHQSTVKKALKNDTNMDETWKESQASEEGLDGEEVGYTAVANVDVPPREHTTQPFATSRLETASAVTIHSESPAENHYAKIDSQPSSEVFRNKKGEQQSTLAESAQDSTAIPLYTSVKEGSGRSPSSSLAAHASELSLSTGEEPETCTVDLSRSAPGPPKVPPYHQSAVKKALKKDSTLDDNWKESRASEEDGDGEEVGYTAVANADVPPREHITQPFAISRLETASALTIHSASPAESHYAKIDSQPSSEVFRNKEGKEQSTLAVSARDNTAIPLYTLPVKGVKEGSGRSPSSSLAAHASEPSLPTGKEPETCTVDLSPSASRPPKVLPYHQSAVKKALKNDSNLDDNLKESRGSEEDGYAEVGPSTSVTSSTQHDVSTDTGLAMAAVRSCTPTAYDGYARVTTNGLMACAETVHVSTNPEIEPTLEVETAREISAVEGDYAEIGQLDGTVPSDEQGGEETSNEAGKNTAIPFYAFPVKKGGARGLALQHAVCEEDQSPSDVQEPGQCTLQVPPSSSAPTIAVSCNQSAANKSLANKEKTDLNNDMSPYQDPIDVLNIKSSVTSLPGATAEYAAPFEMQELVFRMLSATESSQLPRQLPTGDSHAPPTPQATLSTVTESNKAISSSQYSHTDTSSEKQENKAAEASISEGKIAILHSVCPQTAEHQCEQTEDVPQSNNSLP